MASKSLALPPRLWPLDRRYLREFLNTLWLVRHNLDRAVLLSFFAYTTYLIHAVLTGPISLLLTPQLIR